MIDTRLDDRVAIVTGAASGIGLAVVEELARQGASVVMSDINPAGAEIAETLDAQFVQGDLIQREACKTLVDETMQRFGRVDILVNNAGFQHVSPIEDFPEDQWERMIALMLTAPFLLTRTCWPHMKAQGWGRVINMASIHGVVASPYKAAYISAKHGLIGLTRTTALEGGAHGITVNAICPAYVATSLVENQIDAQAEANQISRETVIEDIMLAPAAVKRLIQPSEIADMVIYLCSPSGSAITGASLMVDLGWTAR